MFDQETLLRYTSYAILAVVLLILLFVTSLGYFRADDFSHVSSMRFGTIDNPSSILTEAEYGRSGSHYRPLVKLFFFLNYTVSQLNPTSYFLGNIALFLITLYCLFQQPFRFVKRS